MWPFSVSEVRDCSDHVTVEVLSAAYAGGWRAAKVLALVRSCWPPRRDGRIDTSNATRVEDLCSVRQRQWPKAGIAELISAVDSVDGSSEVLVQMLELYGTETCS